MILSVTQGCHAVLAPVSRCYSPLGGRSPTRYSPVRRSTKGVAPLFALDLHVLGTPPALILSQDQTLQLNLNLTEVRLSTVEIRLGPRAEISLGMIATYLVFKEPPPLGEPDQTIALDQSMSSALPDLFYGRTRLGGKFEACFNPNRTTRRVGIIGYRSSPVKHLAAHDAGLEPSGAAPRSLTKRLAPIDSVIVSLSLTM